MADLKHFRRWQKDHYNFMTPQIVSLRDRGVYIIELSKGRGIRNDTIYGVTLVKMSGSTYESVRTEGINECFTGQNAYTEAQAHIRHIDKLLKENAI